MKKKLIAFTLGLALLGGSAVAAVAATSDTKDTSGTQNVTPNCCVQKAACCTEKAPCCK